MFLVSLFFILRSGHDGAKNFSHDKFFTLQKFAMGKFLCAVWDISDTIIFINQYFTTSNGNLRFCGQEF